MDSADHIVNLETDTCYQMSYNREQIPISLLLTRGEST